MPIAKAIRTTPDTVGEIRCSCLGQMSAHRRRRQGGRTVAWIAPSRRRAPDSTCGRELEKVATIERGSAEAPPGDYLR